MTYTLLSQLRRAVKNLENDLGVAHLSECERDILCAADWCNGDGVFEVSFVLSDDMFKRYSRPTLFRAIKSLNEGGHIKRVGGARSGTYQVIRD